MTVATLNTEQVDRAIAYHGSLCPGLAVGIQAARLALLEVGEHSEAHQVVAVAETDICAVDAVQALTGCTVGNRNLVLLDYGKLAFQFFTEARAIRIAGRPRWSREFQALRKKMGTGTANPFDKARFDDLTKAEVERILSTPADELFTVRDLGSGHPVRSTVDQWLVCSICNEDVMEGRTRHLDGALLCIPCYHNASGKS